FRLRQKVNGWEALGNFRDACRAPLPAPEQTKARKTFTAPDAAVLVVDDTPMNLTVFMGLLKSTKMQIDTAESGGEGLALSRSKKYDIIVMDHMMPEKDGIETLHELKAEADNPNLHTPVICLTANAISGAREMYLAEGFDDYLTKPIEGADLEAALIKYLSQTKVTIQTAPEEGEGGMAEETTALRTFYASVPELNYGDAIRFCANEEILKETLEQFYRAIKPNITAIDGFLRSKDYKNYTIRVHALKSSARLIGAEALSADARHLEDLGNSLTQNDIMCIEELTPRLLEEYQKFLKRLSPLYAAAEAARQSAPEISINDLNEAYAAIKQFIGSFDIDAIDGFMAEIRKYRIPKPEEAKFAAVEECVRNMDWNGLEEVLQEEAAPSGE
nr:response regulator [Fretibacterium sp.]